MDRDTKRHEVHFWKSAFLLELPQLLGDGLQGLHVERLELRLPGAGAAADLHHHVGQARPSGRAAGAPIVSSKPPERQKSRKATALGSAPITPQQNIYKNE